MIRLLFVCLGNICRSPMAEAVMRHKVKARGLEQHIVIDSAGTGDWHIGKPPHHGTRQMLDLYQISYEGMRARQVKGDDFEHFDFIVAMDTSNERDLQGLAGNNPNAKIVRLLNFLPDDGTIDVPDPYYTGNFDEVYNMIDRGCDRLLDWIVQYV